MWAATTIQDIMRYDSETKFGCVYMDTTLDGLCCFYHHSITWRTAFPAELWHIKLNSNEHTELTMSRSQLIVVLLPRVQPLSWKEYQLTVRNFGFFYLNVSVFHNWNHFHSRYPMQLILGHQWYPWDGCRENLEIVFTFTSCLCARKVIQGSDSI